MEARRPTGMRNVSAALSIISSDEIRGVKLTTDALAAQTGVSRTCRNNSRRMRIVATGSRNPGRHDARTMRRCRKPGSCGALAARIKIKEQ